ncbi:MAG: DEAD/DEAH box helicase [Solirubrobacterales bacterium]
MTSAAASGFNDLGLSASTIETLTGLNYHEPTPLQRASIPPQLARKDVLARIAAGDGHQAALALPLIARVLADGPAYNPTALILVPSREAAIRVHETVFQLSARGTAASVLGVYEGKPLTSQIGPLKHGVDIVVGTPGRVMEHVNRRTLRIEQLKVLVLAHADEMLRLGLTREISEIVEVTPKTRQTILFSPTMPSRVMSMAHKVLREPELIGLEPQELASVAASEKPDTKTVNIYFGVGRSAGVTPRDLSGAIVNDGRLEADRIGLIKIKQNFSLVAVPEGSAEDLVRSLQSSLIRGRKTKIRLERFRVKKKS